MANLASCDLSAKGLGISCKKGNPISMPFGDVLAAPGFQFDTYADFLDEDKWMEGIAAGNLFPMVKYHDVDDATIEKQVYTSGSGDEFTTRDSKQGYTGYMDLSPAQNAIIQGYGNINWGIFRIDEAGNGLGQSPDNVVVKPFTMSYFDPETMQMTLGADAISRTPVTIRMANNYEKDTLLVVAYAEELGWPIQSLMERQTTYVEMTNVSIAANVITFSVNFVNNRDASKSTVAVRNVVAANLSVVDQLGAAVIPAPVTETTTEGTYTATTVSMTSGTIKLIATVDSLFYSETVAVV